MLPFVNKDTRAYPADPPSWFYQKRTSHHDRRNVNNTHINLTTTSHPYHTTPTMSLPSTMKALVLNEDSSLTLDASYPFPSPTAGSVTVQVLHTVVNPNFVAQCRDSGASHGFTMPKPSVPGVNAIGRVVAAGPDATRLRTPGQLVAVEPFVRARDDPDGAQIMWGIFDGMTPGSKSLYANAWRDGTHAQYCRAPLENTYPLDEDRLCGAVADGGLGYTLGDLAFIFPHATAYAGMRRIGVQPGETVLVTPATGLFSGASVSAALAVGATVIAASRSADKLALLKTLYPDITTAQLTNDAQADAAAITAASRGRPIDALLEMSPPESTGQGSASLAACMAAVRPYGRICMMGSRMDPGGVPITPMMVVGMNLTIVGSWMYERAHVEGLIRMVESGRLRLGEERGFKVVGKYGLEEWEKAADEALATKGFGSMVLLSP